MATATITTNLGNLAWQGIGDSNITENEDTTVTNSSGADVWWGIGTDTTTQLKNTKSQLFKPPTTGSVVYGFAQSSGGSAQITLTMTGNPPSSTIKDDAPVPVPVPKPAESNLIDELEVEIKIKIKLKDGKIVSVE